MSELRFETLSMLGADVGPENPLPEMADTLQEDNEAERVSSINK